MGKTENPPTFRPFYNFTIAIQFGILLQALKKSLCEKLVVEDRFNSLACLISRFLELNNPYNLENQSLLQTFDTYVIFGMSSQICNFLDSRTYLTVMSLSFILVNSRSIKFIISFCWSRFLLSSPDSASVISFMILALSILSYYYFLNSRQACEFAYIGR